MKHFRYASVHFLAYARDRNNAIACYGVGILKSLGKYVKGWRSQNYSVSSLSNYEYTI